MREGEKGMNRGGIYASYICSGALRTSARCSSSGLQTSPTQATLAHKFWPLYCTRTECCVSDNQRGVVENVTDKGSGELGSNPCSATETLGVGGTGKQIIIVYYQVNSTTQSRHVLDGQYIHLINK